MILLRKSTHKVKNPDFPSKGKILDKRSKRMKILSHGKLLSLIKQQRSSPTSNQARITLLSQLQLQAEVKAWKRFSVALFNLRQIFWMEKLLIRATVKKMLLYLRRVKVKVGCMIIQNRSPRLIIRIIQNYKPQASGMKFKVRVNSKSWRTFWNKR